MQNARELRGNARELRGNARELQGNARELRGNARELQGNARELADGKGVAGGGMLLEGEAGSVLADSFLLLDPVFVEDDFADVGAGRKEVGVCADVPFCAFRREADA